MAQNGELSPINFAARVWDLDLDLHPGYRLVQLLEGIRIVLVV